MPNINTRTGGTRGPAGTHPLTTGRVINATSPVRIDDGDSANLGADRTLSLDLAALKTSLGLTGGSAIGDVTRAGGFPLFPQTFTGYNKFNNPTKFGAVQVSGAQVNYSTVDHVSPKGSRRRTREYEAKIFLAGASVTVTGLCPLGGVVEGVVGYSVSGVNTNWSVGLESGTTNLWASALASGAYVAGVQDKTQSTNRDQTLRGYAHRTGPTNFTFTASGVDGESDEYQFNRGCMIMTTWMVEITGANSG